MVAIDLGIPSIACAYFGNHSISPDRLAAYAHVGQVSAIRSLVFPSLEPPEIHLSTSALPLLSAAFAGCSNVHNGSDTRFHS